MKSLGQINPEIAQNPVTRLLQPLVKWAAMAALGASLSGCVFLAGNEVAAPPHFGKIERHSVGPWEASVGYNNAVRVGQTLYISGYAAEGPMDRAIDEIYRAHEKTLKKYGLSYADVVKETLYARDIEAVKRHNDKRLAFYDGRFPSATWVQVERLYDAKLQLEVELVAAIPLGK